MDIVQIIMLVTAGAVVYMIYKQIDSGSFQQIHKDKQNNTPQAQETSNQPEQKPKMQYFDASKEDRINDLLHKTDELVSAQNFEEAKKSIEAALILQENSDNYMRQGFILKNLNEFEGALEAFDKVLELEPQNDMAYIFKGELYNALNDCKNSKEAFEAALKIDNEYDKTHIEYAKMLIKCENNELAKEHLETASQLDANNEEVKALVEKLEKGDENEKN